jgi:hypothetical protein
MKFWVDVSIDEPGSLWAFPAGTPYPYTLRGGVNIVRGFLTLEALLEVMGGEPTGVAIQLEADEIMRRIGDRGWDLYMELREGRRRLYREAPKPLDQVRTIVQDAVAGYLTAPTEADVVQLYMCQRCGAEVGAGEEESFGRCPACGGRSLDPIG